MRVLMLPSLQQAESGRDGVSQVIKAYHKYLPDYGVELVEQEEEYDLLAGHIYQGLNLPGPYVVHSHGLHWTADYMGYYGTAQYKMNKFLVEAIRRADQVTVPSSWVAEVFHRDMRFTPHVIPHGIDWDDWQHDGTKGTHVLWNKNRAIGVCDPRPVVELARKYPKVHFVTTFLPRELSHPNNTNVVGLIPHDQMRKLVQSSLVYLATTKETFGIGILEAMASGVPVLGYNYGGIKDLVLHGVNGYLAQPGDIEDLAEGLNYCLKNRRMLGLNGRELARGWTWQRAVEKVAEVYRLALEPEPPTVSVVIPVYNKSEEELRRAIESAVNQTQKPSTIIVVDDGSTNGDTIAQSLERYREYGIVQLFRQNNQGVANARNTGTHRLNTKYVCCLDADDWIEPEFLNTCVAALEGDRSLGIAYTGLRYYKPDGETGISQWPGDWDYDAQLKRRNQIPTCCVFRREMWRRLGGYRQRYAPEGAGAEDAEFWLRAGAFGWKAAKVSDEPLFNYSWQSGQVSGDPGYREIDWTRWAPYTKDEQHPFASYATAKHFSHPIRQYDEPIISVIIPVGPGHEANLIDALDSLEAQTFRKWECIVVWDQDDFWPDSLEVAYPYVNWRKVHNGPYGAGNARNLGAAQARAPFLFWLDADDWFYSTKALQKMIDAWNEHKAIPYSDYVGRSFIKDPKDVQKLQDAGRLIAYNQKTNEALTRFKAFDFDCERVLRQPELPRPYTFCLISTLVPKSWHDAIGGFDDKMPSWEDVDYHWRLVRAGRCFVRIDEPLILYRFSTGRRREEGGQIFNNLVQYISEKYAKDGEPMPCSGCGGRRKVTNSSSVWTSTGKSLDDQFKAAGLSDDDLVLVRLVDNNRGDHPIYGTGTVNPLTKAPWNYRHHQHGDIFKVHKDDVYAFDKRTGNFVIRDHRFVPVQDVRVTAPEEEKRETPPPEPIAEFEDDFDEQVAAIVESVETFDLQTLPGVNGPIAAQLEILGLTTPEAIIAYGEEKLAQDVRGVGETRARLIIEAVRAR